MKPQDLPEQYKIYTLVLTDKSEHVITGEQKETILNADEVFIQLKTGTVINKNHIIEIIFESESTKYAFRKLPEAEQKSIVSSITT